MSIETEFFYPEIYYSEESAENYEKNKRMQNIQREMTERAVELLGIKKGKILDVGCGTGFSTETASKKGFDATGIDISKPMIEIARKKGLNVVKADFKKMPFKDGEFDAIISISSLQWITGKSLIEIEKNYEQTAFEFKRVLKDSGKAVVQFYPKTEKEFMMAVSAFKKAGFLITIAEDYPNTTKRKRYIILSK